MKKNYVYQSVGTWEKLIIIFFAIYLVVFYDELLIRKKNLKIKEENTVRRVMYALIIIIIIEIERKVYFIERPSVTVAVLLIDKRKIDRIRDVKKLKLNF